MTTLGLFGLRVIIIAVVRILDRAAGARRERAARDVNRSGQAVSREDASCAGGRCGDAAVRSVLSARCVLVGQVSAEIGVAAFPRATITTGVGESLAGTAKCDLGLARLVAGVSLEECGSRGCQSSEDGRNEEMHDCCWVYELYKWRVK